LTTQNRSHIVEIVELLEGNILHVGSKSICVEIVGDKDKVSTALKLLKRYGIKEVIKTGVVAISKE